MQISIKDIPPEFDIAYYKKIKPYLECLQDIDIIREFNITGIPSGAPGSAFCYKKNIIKFFDEYTPILEIGPGSRPAFKGKDVYYCDIFSPDQLRERAIALGEDIENVPNIIHFLPNELETLDKKFNLIYSSHNIEHQVNILEHLNCIYNHLNKNGLFICFVPNKNYTFDYYRETTSLIDILSGPENARIHPMRTALYSLNRTHNNSLLHWQNRHGPYTENSDELINKYTKYKDAINYESFHAWTFEPVQFKSLFSLLYSHGLIKIKPLRVYNTPYATCEFCAIFMRENE